MTTIVTIDMGGTGATHAAGAREALSVPSMTDMGQSYAQANSARDQANTARDQANTARDTSNNAYAQANTGRSDANTTFASINTTFETVNTSLSTMNINLSSAQTWANIVSFAAYGQANTARGTANDAYAQANAGYIQANAAYGAANTRLSASGGTLSGDLIITGNLTVSGNQTILNTEVLTTEDADIILLSNTSSTPALNAGLIINRGTSTNTFLRWDEALDEWGWSDSGNTTYYFEDLRQGLSTTNTTFSTINTSLGTINTNYQAAYAQANDARGQANTAYGQANDAYTRANTKLDSAGGTISGNLTVTGTLTVSGNVSSINTQSISSVSNEIILNSNASGAPTLDGKLTVNRGSSANVTLLWNETADKWGWTDNGTTYYYFEDLRSGLATHNTTFGTINTSLGTINTSYQAAYAQANTATTNAGNAYGTANTAATNALNAYGQANAAYAQANSAYGAANNRVLKAGDTMTGQLNISSGGLLVTGDVGFGSSPAFTSGSGLEIQRATATATLRLDSSSFATELYGYTGGTGLFQLSAGYLDLGTNNTTRLRIDANGNVSIGATTASSRLYVVGDGVILQPSSYGASYVAGLKFRNEAYQHWTIGGKGSGFVIATTGSAGGQVWDATPSDKVTVESGGNVGIGTGSPTGRLNVYVDSDTNISIGEHPSYGAYNAIWSPSNDYVLLWQNGGHTFLNARGSGDIFFREDNNTLMTLTNGGNLGIGNSPASRLDVSGVSSLRNGIQFFRVNSASTGLSFYNSTYSAWCVYMAATGVTSCGPHGNFTSPGSGHGVTSWALRSFIENSSGYGFTWETGTSTGNPTVIAGLEASTGNFSVAGTVTANSDERVKKNIRRIDNALDKVKNIDGVYFEKIDTEEKSVGVIAQQVEKVLPEVVKLGDPNDPDSIKSVAYGNMVGLLIEAIKEQQKQIEELKAKLIN